MLVLSRKVNESFVIGEGIIVTILATDGDRVKIGVQAPANIRILRQELYDLVKSENLRAAKSANLADASLEPLRQILRLGSAKDTDTS